MKNWLKIFLFLLGVFFFAANARAAFGLDPKIKQVRTAENPTVYYLDHKLGLKKAYVSERAYFSYGNRWNSVRIVSRENLAKWPEIRLVKTANSSVVYYIYNGEKGLITSEQQFNDYGYKWSEVAVISETDLNEYKTVDFNKVKASVVAAPAPVSASSSLSVSLQPISTSQHIPTGSRALIVAAFKFLASDREVKITNLSFTQRGVSGDSVVESAYLTDESGAVFGDKYGLTNKHFYLNLARTPIIIPAGQSKILYLKADLNAVSGVTSQTMRFSLLAAEDITADTGVAAAFPLDGPELKLADGVKNLGRVQAGEIAISSAAAKIGIGANAKAIFSFRLTEISGNEDILIKKIILTNNGSARDGDLANLTLFDQDGGKIMKLQTTADQKAVFALEPGYLLKKNHYATFTVKADIIGGDGKGVNFAVNDSGDIVASDKEGQYNLSVINNAGPGGSDNNFTINRTPVFLTAGKLKAADLVIYSDQDDAPLGQFELRNTATDIIVYSLTISLAKSSGAPALDQPVAVFDGAGKQLGTIDPSKITGSYAEIFTGNFPVAKGKTLKIIFKSHIPDTVKSGDTYQILAKDVTYHIAQDNIAYIDNIGVSGQKTQVVAPAIFFYAGVKNNKDITVAGEDKAILGFFRLEATKESAIKLSSLTITNTAGFKAVNYINGFTNLAVYKGGARIGQVVAQPNDVSYTFENLKATISAGTSADIYLKADIAGNVEGTVKLFMENATAYDSTGKIPAAVNNKNTASPEVVITKTILAVKEAGGGAIALGQKNNVAASFIFTNQAVEKIKITSIVLNSSGIAGNLSANNGFHNLRFGYLNAKNKIVYTGSRLSNPVADVNEIGLGSLTLAPGEALVLNLYADADQNASAGTISVLIRDVYARGFLSGVDAGAIGLPTAAVSVGAQ